MITNRDQLIDALANNSTRIVIDKASIAHTAVGQNHSLWRAAALAQTRRACLRAKHRHQGRAV